MRFKCLNPECHHEWETRGEYAKILRCPRCRKGYVVDQGTFEAAVVAEMNWLNCPIPSAVVAAHFTTHAAVVSKLFPMLPFNAFQVINEEASRRKEEIEKAKRERE